MPRMLAHPALEPFRTLFASGALGGLSDGELLERFLDRRGTDREDAFTALVHRHGPMVLRVCRRMLGGASADADAEDAFQAVFLVLARKAGAIRKLNGLDSWLHGVAIRTAQQSRRQAARRRVREGRAASRLPTVSLPDTDQAELATLLDEEVQRLPGRYREPVMLCEVEGVSRREAAERLGLPEGTVSSRLARGRSLLRERLMRRGVAPGACAIGTLVSGVAEAAPSEALVRGTVARALVFAAGGAGAGTIPPAVAALAKGTLATAVASRLKLVLLAAIMLGTVACLAAALAPPAAAGPGRDEPAAKVVAKKGTREDAKAVPGPSQIRGTVVDERGRPVVGAEVRLQAFTELEIRGVTDASGSFAIRHALPALDGTAVLVRSAEGDRVGFYHYGYDLTSKQADSPLRIVVEPAREVVVRVADTRGTPVPGAVVEVSGDFANLDSTTTDPDGSARLKIPPDSRVKWIFAVKSALGFDFAAFGPVEMGIRTRDGAPARDLPKTISLTLDRPRTVRIRALDSAGKPVAGIGFRPWLLAKEGRPGEVNVASARLVVKTDAEGIATFDWLPTTKGLLQFWPVAEGYANRRVLVEERESKPVTARMERTETIRGRVVRPDGLPAPGISVVATGTGKGWDSGHGRARTAADGAYSMEVSPDEAYAVYVDDKDWAAATRLDVVVRQGKPVADVDFRLTRGTLIQGTVTVGAENRPEPNAWVWIDEATGKQAPKEVLDPGDKAWREVRRQFGVLTDAEGHYALRVGPGTFTLCGPPRTKNEKFVVTNEAEIIRDFAMPRPVKGPLTGRIVVDRDGYKGVAGAKVEVMARSPRGFPETVFTDAEGRFQMERDLDPLVLCAHSPDGKLGAELDVGAEDPEVVLVLGPTATATGVVLNEKGQPAANQELAWGRRIYLNDENQLSTLCFAPKVVTDAEGRFTVPGLVLGVEYEISVVRDRVYLPTGAILPEKEGTTDLGKLTIGAFKPKKR